MSSYVESVVAKAKADVKNRQRRAFFNEIAAPFRVVLPLALAFIVAVISVVVIFACLFDITPLEAANLLIEILHNLK